MIEPIRKSKLFPDSHNSDFPPNTSFTRTPRDMSRLQQRTRSSTELITVDSSSSAPTEAITTVTSTEQTTDISSDSTLQILEKLIAARSPNVQPTIQNENTQKLNFVDTLRTEDKNYLKSLWESEDFNQLALQKVDINDADIVHTYLSLYPEQTIRRLLDAVNLENASLLIQLISEKIPPNEIPYLLGIGAEKLKMVDNHNTIDLFTHAQRQDHFISILNQVEKSGNIDSSNYALRSKQENDLLGHHVVANSPNGKDSALPTISLNLNSVQNGYGDYVWIVPPFYLLQGDNSFTSMMPLSQLGLTQNDGEVGFSSEAIRDWQKNDSNSPEQYRQLVQNGKISGIDLSMPGVLCLVPESDYQNIMLYIDGMKIDEHKKIALKNQIIPHKTSDPLGNDMLQTLRHRPEIFFKLTMGISDAEKAKELALRFDLTGAAERLESSSDNMGYVVKDFPTIDGYKAEDVAKDVFLIEKEMISAGFKFNSLGEGMRLYLLTKIQLFIRSQQERNSNFGKSFIRALSDSIQFNRALQDVDAEVITSLQLQNEPNARLTIMQAIDKKLQSIQ